MFWSGVVRHYCGSKLVADSLSVDVTRQRLENCDCNGVSLLSIDRRGRPLVYMVIRESAPECRSAREGRQR